MTDRPSSSLRRVNLLDANNDPTVWSRYAYRNRHGQLVLDVPKPVTVLYQAAEPRFDAARPKAVFVPSDNGHIDPAIEWPHVEVTLIADGGRGHPCLFVTGLPDRTASAGATLKLRPSIFDDIQTNGSSAIVPIKGISGHVEAYEIVLAITIEPLIH